jgi:YD repeat-containing protein
MRKSTAILFAFAFAFVALSGLAQSAPELERGFKADQLYQFNGLDSVNLFNGNLGLSIPLATYPVSSDVSYAFVLRYSGNAWNYTFPCKLTPIVGDPDPSECDHITWEAFHENAGMGWSLTFGSLDYAFSLYGDQQPTGGTMKYIGPDGGEHLFYETLHDPKCPPNVTDNCDEQKPGVYYTRDGSYLRMKTVGNDRVIEFPNGQKHRFAFTTTGGWRLQRIYGTSTTFKPDGDYDKNWVLFEYIGNDIKVTDSHGRTHWVHFNPIVNGPFDGRLDSLQLAARGGLATYNLVYGLDAVGGTDGTRSVVAKPCDGNDIQTQAVELLRRVELPLGEKWEFNYQTSQTDCNSPAALTRVTLPTGGNLNWTYQRYEFNPPQGITWSAGVKERCLRRDTSLCSISGAQTNQDEYSLYTVNSPSSLTEKVTVTTYSRNSSGQAWAPDSKTENYFSKAYGPSMGLPFDSQSQDGGQFLTSEVFDCDPNGGCPTQASRRQWVRYEWDAVTEHTCDPIYPCGRDRNRRVMEDRTVFPTDTDQQDGDRYAATYRYDFDGLGHYRKIITSGFLAGNPTRETYTGFNLNTRTWNSNNFTGLSVGIYTPLSAYTRADGYAMLDAADSWFLEAYTTAYVKENNPPPNNPTAYSEACFDPRYGFLSRLRVKSSNTGAASGDDLLRIFTRDDTSGYVSREEYFGGDLQTVSTSSLCTLTPPAHNQYSFQIDHTYEYGVPKTSQSSGMSWYSLNNSSINLNTGLVLESKDAAGAATAYDYDARGRLTSVTPPGVSSTIYTYVPVSSTDPAPRVEARTGSITDNNRVEQKWEFDPFGRISIEKRLMPSGSWAVRKTTYNTLGLRSSVSEWENETNATYGSKTSYSNYDPFGRVGTITAPDGKSTTFSYTGDRLRTRAYEVAKEGADAQVTVQEETDRNGRLVEVTEDTTGTALKTDYTYDEGNRLAKVKVWNGTNDQPRTFDYDLRGLLTSEIHPESGTTAYQYDARGNVISKTTPVTTLTYAYDGAGRVTDVKHGATPLKHFAYDRENAGTDLSKGKLDTATRYNDTDLGLFVVKETFFYALSGGRLSSKDTEVTSPSSAVRKFSDEYTYTPNGDLETIKYPRCASGDCSSLIAPSRTITNTYRYGSVTDVAPYTQAFQNSNGITYYPNGVIDTIEHRNVNGDAGPRFKQTIANKMARTDSITVSNFCDTLSVSAPGPQPRSVVVNSPAGLSVTATNATSYQWYRVDGSTNTELSGQTGTTLTVAVTQDSTYFVRVGNGVCTVDSERATVTVQACTPVPDATITAPSTIMASTVANASVPNTSGATYEWSINTVGGWITAGQGTPQITFGAQCSGTIHLSVKVTNSNGCEATNSRDVTITPAVATMSGSSTITQGASAQISVAFNGPAPPWTVTWSDNPSQVDTVYANPFSRTVTPGTTTSYSITAKDVNGCDLAISGSPVTITVQACTFPDATITADSTIGASATGNASVPATTGATYLWSVNGGVILTGQGTRAITYRANCSGTVNLSVAVNNGCNKTNTKFVAINPATATLSVVGSSTISQGGTAQMQVALTGVGPWAVTWSDNPGQAQTISSSPYTRTVTSINQTTSYSITAQDAYGCNMTISGSPVTITVKPPAPSNVQATASSTTQVNVTWSFSGTADRFDIYRSGTATAIGSAYPPSLSYNDMTAVPSTAYVYSVKAVKGTTPSDPSNGDLATTVLFADDPIVANVTVIRVLHVTQLQTAVNAVRVAAGLAPQSFATFAVNSPIYAWHFEELRTALAPARAALGLSAVAYTRAPLTTGMPILGSDIADTRTGVR